MTEKLRGVTLARVDRKHLAKVVKQIGLNCDTSVDSLVGTFSDHIVKVHKSDPDSLLECNYCGGASDVSFDVCPYCGLTDEEANKKADEAPPVPEAPPLVNARAAKAPKPPKEKPATAPEAPTEPPADEKPKKGPGRPKKDKSVPGPTPEEPVHTAEIVKSGETVIVNGEVMTVQHLDATVAAIKNLQADIVENHWLLGQKLGETWELFKLRTNDDNSPKYKNWASFVAEEIQITPRYAFDLVAVSKAFSAEDIREVGVTKLRILARIPDEVKQKNLLEEAKRELNGKPAMSRTELEQKARADGPLPPRPTLDGRVNTEETVEKRARKAKDRADAAGVSMVVQMGRVTLPMFAGKKSRESSLARAQDVKDEPEAVEDLLNGVKVRYRIAKEADGLVLVVERVRE